MRGIDTLTAVGLIAEIGDFRRLGHPEQVMSYLGVVPSEQVLSDEVCVVVVTDSALVAGKDTDDYQVHLL